MQGHGKRVLPADSPASERAGYDLFQEFVPDRREYRVTLLNGRVVSAHLRRPAADTPADELSPNWTYQQLDTLPRSVARVAREAGRRVGLDLAGVDVLEDLHTGRVLCLEANSAPGMSSDTLRSLYAGVQQLVRGRFERAG
jgi:glutathione synthase/RimK-type ligase-like ATP-grasp enzyme